MKIFKFLKINALLTYILINVNFNCTDKFKKINKI